MGYEPQLVDAKNRSLENLVENKLLNGEKIPYYANFMARQIPIKTGIFQNSDVLFTNHGRVMCYAGGGFFGEDKCFIADSVTYSIESETSDELPYRICIKTTGYPLIDSTISLKNFIEYSERCKKPLNINYNGYKIVENTKIAQLQILPEGIILEYTLSGERFKNEILYKYMKSFKYYEKDEKLVITGIFNDLFSNFPNTLTIKNIKLFEYQQILDNYNKDPYHGELFTKLDVKHKYIYLDARYIESINGLLQLYKEKKLIANIIENEIRFIDYENLEFVGSANLRNSLFVKYNSDIMFIYTDKYFLAVKDNLSLPTNWSDGVPYIWQSQSGIQYLLANTYSKNKSLGTQQGEYDGNLLKTAISDFLTSNLQVAAKNMITNFNNSRSKNLDIYKEYNISDLPDEYKYKIGLIFINKEVYPLKIYITNNGKLQLNIRGNRDDYIIDIFKDISGIEVIDNVCEVFYNVKIDTNKDLSINIGMPIDLYYDINMKFIQNKIQFTNLNSAYFEWSKTLREIVIYYYFAIPSELKGYLDNCLKQSGMISNLSKTEKIKVINVMYDSLKQYKNALMQFSAYFSKELYEEHAKDNNIYFKQNFDQLQNEMISISNQITRHINDCLSNLNNLITYVYPELDIRKAIEKRNKKRMIMSTVTYAGLGIITGRLSLIAMSALNGQGIFDAMDRSKVIDNMEEAKINIFLNNSINEFNILMETLIPKYVKDINDFILTFTKRIDKYYIEDDTGFLRQCVINNKIFLETPISPDVIKKKQLLSNLIIDKAVNHKTDYLENNINGFKKINRAEYHRKLQGGK